MTDQSQDDDRFSSGDAPNPDVPPEYLGLPTNPGAADIFSSADLPPVPPAPLPDVPPEYLSAAPEYQSGADVFSPADAQYPAPSTDVPPEYLGGADIFPSANAQHPAPSTDVPAEYLPDPSPTFRADLPPTPAAYPGTPIPPAGYNTPPAVPGAPKDRSIALILEILPSFFGFYGIGWIYAGNLTVGLILLVGMLALIAVEVVLMVITMFIACFCILPFNVIVIAASALALNDYMKKRPDEFKA